MSKETPRAKLLRKYRASNFKAIPSGGGSPMGFNDWEKMGGTLTALGWIQSRKKWRRLNIN